MLSMCRAHLQLHKCKTKGKHKLGICDTICHYKIKQTRKARLTLESMASAIFLNLLITVTGTNLTDMKIS